MTVGQFLQKLPKSVVKDGKVIDIRNSVGENLTVICGERERDRQTERDIKRKKEISIERDKKRETKREIEIDQATEREKEIERERKRDLYREKKREREIKLERSSFLALSPV